MNKVSVARPEKNTTCTAQALVGE